MTVDRLHQLLGGPDAFRRLVAEVVACGAEAQRLFDAGAAAKVTEKPDRSPVTEVDHALERRLRQHVSSHHPRAAFIGEESGHSGPEEAPLRFLVDPIDGTRAFVRGIPTWSVLVGIELDGEPAAGIAFMPAVDDLYTGIVGAGADKNGRPLELSAISRLDDATVCHAMLGHFAEVGALSLLGKLAHGTHTQRGVHDFDGFREVLDGRAEAMVDPGAAAWDLCAPAALIRAAGGRLTALDGSPTIRLDGGVASNGRVHDALIALLDVANLRASS